MTVADDAADVLEKAADLAETEEIEWCRGEMFRVGEGEKQQACAVGLIRIAARNLGLTLSIHTPNQRAWRATVCAERALAVQIENRSVPIWNDHPGRTKEEVIDTMKSAAKYLRNGEPYAHLTVL